MLHKQTPYMRWKIKEDGNKEQIAQLKKELLIPEIIAKLLVERGITTFDAAKNFFRPSIESLHNPFLMEDMQKAVDRVNEALDKGQRISNLWRLRCRWNYLGSFDVFFFKSFYRQH